MFSFLEFAFVMLVYVFISFCIFIALTFFVLYVHKLYRFQSCNKITFGKKTEKNGKRTKRRTSFLGGHFTHPEISYFRFMMGFGFNSCFIVPYMLSKFLLLVARSIAVFKYTLSMAISLDWERLLDLANHLKSRSDRSFVRPPISVQAWVIAPPPLSLIEQAEAYQVMCRQTGLFL